MPLSSKKTSSKKSTKISSLKKPIRTRKTVRRSSSRKKKIVLPSSPTPPFISDSDYDSLSHSLLVPQEDEVEQSTYDLSPTYASSVPHNNFESVNIDHVPERAFDFARELLPTSQPKPKSRVWLWVGVASFLLPIFFFWGCAMKNQFATLTSSNEQNILTETKDSWNSAFASDTSTSSPTSSVAVDLIPTSTLSEVSSTSTTSTLPLHPLDIDRLTSVSEFDPFGFDNEAVLSDINKANRDRIDNPSRILKFSTSTFGIAWSESNREKPYIGYAALIKNPGEQTKTKPFTTIKKIKLPTPVVPWSMDGLRVEDMAYADIFGTGTKLWLLTYSITEPPRPDLGSKTHEYILALSPDNATILWNYEIYQASQALVEQTCSADLYTYSPSTNSPHYIVSIRTCYNEKTCIEMDNPPADADCTPHRTTEIFTWNPDKKIIEHSTGTPVLLQQITSLVPPLNSNSSSTPKDSTSESLNLKTVPTSSTATQLPVSKPRK